jgi:hypothetical protein
VATQSAVRKIYAATDLLSRSLLSVNAYVLVAQVFWRRYHHSLQAAT